MTAARVIPCLLLKGKGLVKGVRFKRHTYVGDPMNAVKIFNDKQVDELIFLDIAATAESRVVPIDVVQRIADECYVPFCVGGGIRTVQQIRDLLSAGAEKVAINTAAFENPCLVKEAAAMFGSQSIVVSIDCRRAWYGGTPRVYTHNGTRRTNLKPIDWARRLEELGAGELFVTSVEHDGTMAGYDCALTRIIADSVSIPIIACGGAGTMQHIRDVLDQGHASAAAAGSMFVYHGPRRAVLINYPTRDVLENIP